MGAAPLTEFISPSQKEEALRPIGVNAPIPVTTTLLNITYVTFSIYFTTSATVCIFSASSSEI